MTVTDISKAINRIGSQASLLAMRAVVKKKKTYFSNAGRYGYGWKPLRDRTIDIKKSLGMSTEEAKRKNYRTGHLMRSLKAEFKSSNDDVDIESMYNLSDKNTEKSLENKDSNIKERDNVKLSDGSPLDSLSKYYPKETVIHYNHEKGDQVVYQLCYDLKRNFLVYGDVEFKIAMAEFDKVFIRKWKAFVKRHGEDYIIYILSNNITSNRADDYHLVTVNVDDYHIINKFKRRAK